MAELCPDGEVAPVGYAAHPQAKGIPITCCSHADSSGVQGLLQWNWCFALARSVCQEKARSTVDWKSINTDKIHQSTFFLNSAKYNQQSIFFYVCKVQSRDKRGRHIGIKTLNFVCSMKR